MTSSFLVWSTKHPGANSGIGYETAKHLARRGAVVVLGCRTKETAERSLKEIREVAKDPENVTYESLDLESFQSVCEFAERISARFPRVDVLLNNAGLVAHTFHLLKSSAPEVERKREEEHHRDHESMYRVNFLATYLLTMRLIPLLEKSNMEGGGRIVIVSCAGLGCGQGWTSPGN